MNSHEFYKRLAAKVQDNPIEALTALQAVTEGLSSFQDEVKKSRDSKASNALVGLLGLIPKGKKVATPYAIDAAFYLFPDGPKTGSAKVVRDFWDGFIAGARANPVDRFWLENIKGAEYAEWWDLYVKPCLDAGASPG